MVDFSTFLDKVFDNGLMSILCGYREGSLTILICLIDVSITLLKDLIHEGHISLP